MLARDTGTERTWTDTWNRTSPPKGLYTDPFEYSLQVAKKSIRKGHQKSERPLFVSFEAIELSANDEEQIRQAFAMLFRNPEDQGDESAK